VDPATWDRNRPLSGPTVNRLLKHYARRADLDPRQLHVHVLRHSAAMLEEESGAGLLTICRLLGHADPKTTLRYLDHLRGQPDTAWVQKCALLRLDGARP
jgi:site-specific recombinase XerD